jgi:hypothetical protein
MKRFSCLLAMAVLAVTLLTTSTAFAADTLVSGTSSAGTSSYTHPARYMNDGRSTTYWAASSTAVPQIVTVDLGSAKSLTASDVSWKVKSAPGFRVYGSNDASVWTELSNRDANTLKTTHTAISGTYRYVRMRVNKLDSGSAGIYEWKLYAVTPTPTPTASATVTPTPTPTPSAPAAAGPAPGTVFTSSGPLVLDNVHDRVYDGYRFSGSSADAESGVIEIKHASYNITFRNCVIATNGNGVGNGVTVLDTGWGVHDITFDHCRFEYQPRMGIEVISRRADRGAGNYPGYLRVNLTGCSFAAQGSEAISYDDDDPGHAYNGVAQGAGQCTVSGNVVLGAGLNSAYSWRRTFEINRTRNMTVTGNWFGPGVDGMTNLRQNPSDPANANWTFAGNTWDATAYLAGVSYGSGNVTRPTLWYTYGAHGGVSVSDRLIVGLAPYSTTQWGYLDTVSGADFSGSTVHGCPATAYGKEGTVSILCPVQD